MNVTFLIGNGFDIGMGLNSRFKDFFPIYQIKSNNKPDRIKMLSRAIEGDYETWADFETALGKYTLEFTSETKQDFIDQLRDFENDFMEYLESQEDMLSFDSTTQISATMTEALKRYYGNGNFAFESQLAIERIYSTRNSENHTYNFVNFNYTNVLEKCLDTIPQKVVNRRKHNDVEKVDKIGKVIHVHGKSGSYPIIGVNDVGQIENKELAKDTRFTRFIVKPSLNQMLRLGNDTAATEIINQSTIICVYGMSMGATDKKWWAHILSWLDASGDRQLVVFDHDDTYTSSNQFGWLEKENSYMDKLSTYSNMSDIEKLRSRIHIAVHKNIFEMDITKRHKVAFEEAFGKVLAEI